MTSVLNVKTESGIHRDDGSDQHLPVSNPSSLSSDRRPPGTSRFDDIPTPPRAWRWTFHIPERPLLGRLLCRRLPTTSSLVVGCSLPCCHLGLLWPTGRWLCTFRTGSTFLGPRSGVHRVGSLHAAVVRLFGCACDSPALVPTWRLRPALDTLW